MVKCNGCLVPQLITYYVSAYCGSCWWPHSIVSHIVADLRGHGPSAEADYIEGRDWTSCRWTTQQRLGPVPSSRCVDCGWVSGLDSYPIASILLLCYLMRSIYAASSCHPCSDHTCWHCLQKCHKGSCMHLSIIMAHRYDTLSCSSVVQPGAYYAITWHSMPTTWVNDTAIVKLSACDRCHHTCQSFLRVNLSSLAHLLIKIIIVNYVTFVI